jgi:hypothetical protein
MQTHTHPSPSQVKLHSELFASESGLATLCVQGKYGFFIKELIRAYEALSSGSEVVSSGSEVVGFEQRAHCLYQALRNTVIRLAKNKPEDEQTWVKNCGRNVSHHSGYLPLLARLNIICKSEGHERNARKAQVFTLGLLKTTYQFQPKKAAIPMLTKWAAASDCLALHTAGLPTSCAVWLQQLASVQDSMLLHSSQHIACKAEGT